MSVPALLASSHGSIRDRFYSSMEILPFGGKSLPLMVRLTAKPVKTAIMRSLASREALCVSMRSSVLVSAQNTLRARRLVKSTYGASLQRDIGLCACRPAQLKSSRPPAFQKFLTRRSQLLVSPKSIVSCLLRDAFLFHHCLSPSGFELRRFGFRSGQARRCR